LGILWFDELDRLGIQAHVKIKNGKLSEDDKKAMILAINENSAKMTLKGEALFSNTGKYQP